VAIGESQRGTGLLVRQGLVKSEPCVEPREVFVRAQTLQELLGENQSAAARHLLLHQRAVREDARHVCQHGHRDNGSAEENLEQGEPALGD
jgi:hypothetical protein